MKILQISDVHGSLEAVSKASEKAANYDVIAVVGDITHFGGVPHAEALLNILAKAGRPVLFVAGNCDHPSLLTWQPTDEKLVNLHLKKVSLEGVEFAGLGGGNVSPFNTLIEFTEKQFEDMLAKLNPVGEKFVLISHTPPHGVDADYARQRHLGSVAIRRFVEAKRPLAVCCGHIHEGRSVSKINDTVVVNAGPAKEGFFASVEVTGLNVSAELLRL